MNKNKKFQFFDSLQTSEELRQKILDKTINNNVVKHKFNIRKIPKLAYALSILLAIIFVGCTGALAFGLINTDLIKTTIGDDGNVYQTFELDEPVIINDVKNFKCKGISLEEIGNSLGLQFAHDPKYNDIVDNCDIKTNEEGKVELVELYIYDHKDYSEENNKIEGYDSNFENAIGWHKGKHLGLTISFITQYATDEVKEEFAKSNETMTPHPMDTKVVELNNLGVTAYTYEPAHTKGRFFTFVVFEQNNILYNYDGYRLQLDDLIDFVQNLDF